uniref:Uncharacterized protein n=1 Tax=Leersia perrieri TaxID=77586 RepID=A0A0D9UX72_9ORYZ
MDLFFFIQERHASTTSSSMIFGVALSRGSAATWSTALGTAAGSDAPALSTGRSREETMPDGDGGRWRTSGVLAALELTGGGGGGRRRCRC